MLKFRKKPVVIEAVQFTGLESMKDIYLLAPEHCGITFNDQILIINTSEGKMRASDGDWIIKGVAGEVYSCKPDIFEATYEKVDETEYSSCLYQ